MRNATAMGERLYRSLGFQSLGFGQTYWLHRDVLEAAPATPAQVRFYEAAGRGDVPALRSLAATVGPEALDAPLASGITPLQLAVAMKQPAAVELR